MTTMYDVRRAFERWQELALSLTLEQTAPYVPEHCRPRITPLRGSPTALLHHPELMPGCALLCLSGEPLPSGSRIVFDLSGPDSRLYSREFSLFCACDLCTRIAFFPEHPHTRDERALIGVRAKHASQLLVTCRSLGIRTVFLDLAR